MVTACNQKTNREPVMSLSESEVQALLDTLVKRHHLRTVSGFGNRVTANSAFATPNLRI